MGDPETVLDSVPALRTRYRQPGAGAVNKEIDHLDDNCRSFLAHATFVVLATADADGRCDASPKGGPPGFARVIDDGHLAWGDLAGNNRLDSFTNLVGNDFIGLLFMIPGLDESLRVNGRAVLTTAPDVLAACALDGRAPSVAVVVAVETAYIHCAKAFRRGAVWRPDEWPDTTDMPTIACMLRDHYGLDELPDAETVAARLEENYRATIWQAGGR